MCSIVFLQEEKDSRHVVFVKEENETVDMCTNFIVYSSGGERDCRHLY